MRSIAALVVVAAGSTAWAQEVLVLNARPSRVCITSPTEGACEALPESKSFEYQLVLARDGKGYLWKSRGGRKLVRVASGIFDYFIEPGGAGYVKVAGLCAGGRAQYLEHMSLGLETYTYWGEGIAKLGPEDCPRP